MFKKRKIKLGFVATTVLVATAVLFILLLAFASIEALQNLGNFAAGKIKASITQQASELFLEDTKQKAGDFSNIINQTSNKVNSLNNQMLLILKQLDDYEFSQQDINNFCGKFRKENAKGVLCLIDSNNDYLYGYDLIPSNMQKNIYFLSSILPITTQKIVTGNPYYAAVWICFYYDLFVIGSEKTISESLYNNNEQFKDFLIKAREMGEVEKRTGLYISELYKDITSRMIISVTNYNFHNTQKIINASGIDILIDELTNNIVSRTVPVFPNNMKSNSMEFNIGLCSFVIDSKDSRIIAFPQSLSNMIGFKKEDFDKYNYLQLLNTKMSDSKISEVKKLATALEKNHTGKLEITLDGIEYIIAYCRTTVKDWVFGVIVPLKDLLSAVQAANQKVKGTTIEFEVNLFLVSLLLLTVSIIVIVIFFNKFLISPIVRLQNKVSSLGSGNFYGVINERGCSELVSLSDTFNLLSDELKRHTEDLKKELAARRRREKELETAKQIQQTILPDVSSVCKRNSNFELSVELEAAKEVAGDFYDFFYVRKDILALLIADVSGKGLSAAFYMSISKKIIRDACMMEYDNPAKALKLANETLGKHDVNMFVSVFLIYYDVKTGDMLYANGGHCEALKVSADGQSEFFGDLSNMALGFFTGVPYKKAKYSLSPGDILVLYTDGITEANFSDENFYGEDRLKQFVSKYKDLGVDGIAIKLIVDVKDFEKDNQFDDKTLIFLRRKTIHR